VLVPTFGLGDKGGKASDLVIKGPWDFFDEGSILGESQGRQIFEVELSEIQSGRVESCAEFVALEEPANWFKHG
jgi:hypothetical protein